MMSDRVSEALPTGERDSLVARVRRVLTVTLTLGGFAHLLFPGELLGIAGRLYDRVLAVNFRPREGATTRVRLVGLAMLLGSALLVRLDGGS